MSVGAHALVRASFTFRSKAAQQHDKTFEVGEYDLFRLVNLFHPACLTEFKILLFSTWLREQIWKKRLKCCKEASAGPVSL